MQKVDILVYKVESFDSDCFKKDLISLYPNSIILMRNLMSKDCGIYVAYKPSNCKLKGTILTFLRFNKEKLDYYMYPVLFLIELLRIFKLFFSIFIKYKVRVVLIENTYFAFIAGIMRKCNLVGKMIYICGDWLVDNKTKMGIWSYIGCNMVFPFFDYWACRFSDVTMDSTALVNKSRYNYWGRTIPKKEIILQNWLEIKPGHISSNFKKKIVFIGNIRRDSGLSLIIPTLKKIKKNFDISLKIIGAHNIESNNLYNSAKKYGVDQYIEFLGFVERNRFNDVLSDCFCGVNLITIRDSYSSKIIPAKIYDYLQYIIPVIVTRNLNFAAEIIETNKLGLVVDYSQDALINAIAEIYRNQEQYRQNIIEYVRKIPQLSIKEIIEA